MTVGRRSSLLDRMTDYFESTYYGQPRPGKDTMEKSDTLDSKKSASIRDYCLDLNSPRFLVNKNKILAHMPKLSQIGFQVSLIVLILVSLKLTLDFKDPFPNYMIGLTAAWV